jgi:hypothetical protein
MKKEAEFTTVIIAVTYSGYPMLVDGSDELHQIMDGDGFEDNTQSPETFPTVPGVYRCTIEYHFAPGFFEGFPAPGEADWDLRATDVVEIATGPQ